MRIYSNVPLADMPPELVAAQADHLLNEGFLDVTKAPYNAANDGSVDVTAVLQQAIDDAFFNNLVVYFPKGTYLVSGQLRMEQRRVPGKPKGQRKFANILVGDDSGGTSPVIKLQDGASFDQDRLLQFEYVGTDDSYTSRATRHYNAALRGLAIDMGDNPTKTALSMDGAQYCVIEDVEIYGEFDIGIHGLPGSGGSVTNVTITGGNIGIRQDLYRPSPSIQAVTLIGQKQYGIKLDQSRGPLVVSGFEIVGPRDGSDQYRAIWLQSREIDADPATANLVLSDGTIEVFGEGPAIENFDQDMYLRNVYVNAELIASSGAKHSPVEELGGKAGAWTKVGAYMFINGSDGTLATLDGESFGTQGEDREYRDDIAIVDAPPDDLVSRHSWDQSTFPTYFDGAVIDVVKDYGVTRDDNGDDDAPLINQALRDSVTPGHPHSGKPVFLPRGHFHIASTVTVPAGAS